MRLARVVAAAGLVAAGIVVVGVRTAQSQTGSCTGNNVIEQAPFTCTETRTITGIEFTVTLAVDAAGRAVIDYTMSPVQQADVPIAVHNYTDIDSDPRQFINDTIVAGQTTAQLVIPTIDCGQIDMKAVDVTPGAPAGLIAGPVVTWGQVCQQVPTTTTTPTTVAPTTTPVVPTSIGPTTSRATVPPSTLPPTGGGSNIPWFWGLVAIGTGLALTVVPRFWRQGAEG
jgi:hypothetical protein